MSAGIYNLTVEQGATLSKVITWTDENGAAVNLTNYLARAQGRRTQGASTALFDIDNGTKGGIVLGGAAGTITLTITDEVTAVIPACRGVWDLELESPSGVVTRLLEGKLTVTAEVTR
jgi:hypothetical protein